MISQEPQEAEQEKEQGSWIQRTSQKILAIGAGLRAFLIFTDRIAFSPNPTHEPDKEFIAQLVKLLDQHKPQPASGDD